MSNQNAPFGLKPVGKSWLELQQRRSNRIQNCLWCIWKHFFRRPSEDDQRRNYFSCWRYG
jgi:hypothetical protein